ncbi:MAG: hypothetical protein H7A37_02490 [Chlamydiales bacterium]|nr:hypothetical protein [Chlamydiia bacterium]MCP5507157.1 hypothetical protein [Chlamydiales bacterium]
MTLKCETFSGFIVQFKNWCEGLHGSKHAEKQRKHIENLFNKTMGILEKNETLSSDDLRWCVDVPKSKIQEIVKQLELYHTVQHQEQLDVMLTLRSDDGDINIGSPPVKKECTTFWGDV